MVSFSIVFFQSPSTFHLWGDSKICSKETCGKLCWGDGIGGRRERKALCMGKQHSQSTYKHKKKFRTDKLEGLNSCKESIPAILLYSLATQLKHLQGEAIRLPQKRVESRQLKVSKAHPLTGWIMHTFLLPFPLFPLFDGEEHYTRLCPWFPEKFQLSETFQ